MRAESRVRQVTELGGCSEKTNKKKKSLSAHWWVLLQKPQICVTSTKNCAYSGFACCKCYLGNFSFFLNVKLLPESCRKHCISLSKCSFKSTTTLLEYFWLHFFFYITVTLLVALKQGIRKVTSQFPWNSICLSVCQPSSAERRSNHTHVHTHQ